MHIQSLMLQIKPLAFNEEGGGVIYRIPKTITTQGSYCRDNPYDISYGFDKSLHIITNL